MQEHILGHHSSVSQAGTRACVGPRKKGRGEGGSSRGGGWAQKRSLWGTVGSGWEPKQRKCMVFVSLGNRAVLLSAVYLSASDELPQCKKVIRMEQKTQISDFFLFPSLLEKKKPLVTHWNRLACLPCCFWGFRFSLGGPYVWMLNIKTSLLDSRGVWSWSPGLEPWLRWSSPWDLGERTSEQAHGQLPAALQRSVILYWSVSLQRAEPRWCLGVQMQPVGKQLR